MKHFVSFCVFSVIAFIVWWSLLSDVSDESSTNQAKSKRYLEIFMNDFEMTAMDNNGIPGYLLNGAKLQKFNDSEDTEIKQPVFQLLQQDGQWLISADEAVLSNNNETVTLLNNVVMKQQNIEPAVTINTRSLVILTSTQTARTDDEVEIIQGNSRMHSKGMVFDNKSGELELSSEVNGYYLPYE